MPRKKLFTTHESVLLLEAYLSSLLGEVSREDAIASCSQDLRRMAVNSGMVIDGTYRNVSGIAFQMSSMEAAYSGQRIFKPSTKLFREVVQLREENFELYKKLLREAKCMAERETNVDFGLNSSENVFDASHVDENSNAEAKLSERESDKSKWLPILQDNFLDGYILNDFLCQLQAVEFWLQRYGNKCPIEGRAIDEVMQDIGVVKDGRVFAKKIEDILVIYAIRSELKKLLSCYTSVYRSCIYERYQEKLATCQIYSEPVMTQQLLVVADGNFYSVNRVFAKPNLQVSVFHDCRKVLRDHGGPMSMNDISNELWFIPNDIIQHTLSVDDEVLNVGNGIWMLVEHFPMTPEDARKIGNMLSEYFVTKDYLLAVDLHPLLQKHLPSIADNLNGLKYMAIFNVVAYYLKGRFSFSRAIVSPLGTTIDFAKLFGMFVSEHEMFSLSELESLSDQLKLPIYWESIYANGAVRISKTDFVHKNCVSFDVEAIDRVLEDFCPGAYLPIQSVSSAMMMHLPSCGYKWNGYLLLSYVLGFSRIFRLLYNSLSKTGFYGAMIRKDGNDIDSYRTLLEHVLTDDDTWTTTADALELLVKQGYQVFRKYKDIDAVVEKVRQNKRMIKETGI